MSSPSATADDESCAACGKAPSHLAVGTLVPHKKCAACHLVRYCSVECQRSHRPSHKKACKRRAAEIHDEKLFAQPPPQNDCPVCMLPLPIFPPMRKYQACCGAITCMGCCVGQYRIGGVVRVQGSDQFVACPFCRKEAPFADRNISEKIKKRIELGDAEAFAMFGTYYLNGTNGVTRDDKKGFELLTKGAKLGSIQAHYLIGTCYQSGVGVGKNVKKAIHHFEIAAIGGDAESRSSLGRLIHEGANETSEHLWIKDYKRSMDHYVIGAKMGHKGCMRIVKASHHHGSTKKHVHEGFGYITKEKLEEVKNAYIASIREMNSKDRETMEMVFRQSGDYESYL